ncbi:hypothetical protein F2Q70_00043452 [Brassica cretica]|uniref:Uncharacterized protein n=1 Tax=Brassica cretica TaxID=69181 RepID=A0A8S9KHX2_BRACR|nr:hypothetical protein F2Q70_00043452 [Brassica cretica]
MSLEKPLRFTQQIKGDPVPQDLLDRLCELIAVLAGGAAAKSEALKGLALAFHRKLESYESEPNVVLATSIISKTVRSKIDKIERKGLCKTLDSKKLSDASTEIDGSNNILELAPAAIARTTNTVTKKETTVLRRSFATKREEDDAERVEIQPNDDFRASLL